MNYYSQINDTCKQMKAKRFQCDLCQHKATEKGNLKKHVESVHKGRVQIKKKKKVGNFPYLRDPPRPPQ